LSGRLSVRLTLFACVAALLAILAAGCGADIDGIAPDFGVSKAEDLGIVEVSGTIRGRDGGYSGMAFGRSVWVFGDTVLSQPTSTGVTWLNNSWSYTTDLDAGNGVSGLEERLDDAGTPNEFFPLTPEEQEYNEAHRGDPCKAEPCGARWAMWPGPVVADEARGRVLIVYGKVHAAPGDFNFYGVGQSIAVWKSFDALPERPVLAPGTEEPTLMFSKDEPSFGSAAVVHDDMLYVWACDLDWLAKPCRLARVPLEKVLERKEWRYFAGESDWSADLRDAEPVFEGNDIMSVFWCPHLERFVALYSQPMDRVTSVRTAVAPQGPWTKAVKAFDALKPDGDGWIYDALAHPELAEEDGRVQYVTYSRATGFLQSEMRLVRVKLDGAE